MGEDRPETSQPREGGVAKASSDDYSYDMAHEVPRERSGRHMSTRQRGHTGVDIPPPDPEGDYSYDLAHEVPPPRR